MKRCSKCQQTKPFSEFTKSKHQPDGYDHYCRECKYKQNRKYRTEKSENFKESTRRTQRKFKYGITEEEYQNLLSKQNGKCAICGDALGPGRASNIDHCHDSGVIRGVLCGGCNRGLGHFKDSPERLQKAIEYLALC